MSSRYSISMTAALRDRLKKRSKEIGQSMASIVDEATKDCVAPAPPLDPQYRSPDTSPAPISSSSSCDTAST